MIMCKIRNGLAGLILICCGAFAGENADVKPVEVEGVGVDKQACLQDAFKNAARKVVPGYTDSLTEANNDSLNESMLEVRGAFVDKYDTLKEPAKGNDGLFRCKLRVYVRTGQGKNTTSTQKATTMKDAIAEISTKIDNEEQGIALLRRYLTGLEQKLQVVRIVGEDGKPVRADSKPKIERMPDGQIKCTWRLQVYFDLRTYYEYVCPVLDKVFTATGDVITDELIVNSKLSKENKEKSPFPMLVVEPSDLFKLLEKSGAKMQDEFIMLSIGRDSNATQERYKLFKISPIYAAEIRKIASETPVLKIRMVRPDKSLLMIDQIICGKGSWLDLWASLMCTPIKYSAEHSWCWISPRFGRCDVSNYNKDIYTTDVMLFDYEKLYSSPQELETLSHLEFEFGSEDLSKEPNAPSKTLLYRE